jgi:hypothetical protein
LLKKRRTKQRWTKTTKETERTRQNERRRAPEEVEQNRSSSNTANKNSQGKVARTTIVKSISHRRFCLQQTQNRGNEGVFGNIKGVEVVWTPQYRVGFNSMRDSIDEEIVEEVNEEINKSATTLWGSKMMDGQICG